VNHSPEEAATRDEGWLRWLFGACLLHAIWAMSVGWNHSILGLHAFRQTQTAMAAEGMLAGSSWLRYETPMLGVPWSIPFEFPLYQWILAGASGLLGSPIAQTGRVISIAFFFATLVPLISLQDTLGIRGNRRLILPCLMLVSPTYIYWSRAVMIESTVLFFAVSYLALFAAFLLRPDAGRYGTLCLAAACGAIGAMVKITTIPAFLVAGSVLLGLVYRGSRRFTGKLVAALVLGLAVPALAGVAWSRFAEAQRELNPIADVFLTRGAISKWFLGTIGDRLSFRAWETALTGAVVDCIGNWGSVLGAFFLAFVVPRRERNLFLACLGLFLVAPALFLPLHRTHEYYSYANAVFLLAAVAFTIGGVLRSGLLVRRLGMGLLGLALISSVFGYHRLYYRAQKLDVRPDPGFVNATHQAVAKEGVLLIYNGDWSPEIPYYLGRRAIVSRDNAELDSPVMRQALEGLSRAGYRVEAMLICSQVRGDSGLIRRTARILGYPTVPLYRAPDCDLYGPPR